MAAPPDPVRTGPPSIPRDSGPARPRTLEVERGQGAGEAPVARGEVLAPPEARVEVAQQHDEIARRLEPLRRPPLGILEKADHPDDGSGQDGLAERLVVEGDVPADHRDLERPARRGDS